MTVGRRTAVADGRTKQHGRTEQHGRTTVTKDGRPGVADSRPAVADGAAVAVGCSTAVADNRLAATVGTAVNGKKIRGAEHVLSTGGAYSVDPQYRSCGLHGAVGGA